MNNTDLFDFLENSKFEAIVHSIKYDLIRQIRFLLRSIYSVLLDTDSNELITSSLRLELLKLQSSPVPPSVNLLKECNLTSFETNKNRYGIDFANDCKLLDESMRFFNKNKSPLVRELLKAVSIELQNNCKLEELKIWCHKNEQEAYVDLFNQENIFLSEENFITSLAEYRKTDFFKILIRLGPLRLQGWSKTPSVIITAPRYEKLIQFLWSHSSNEETFGFEPVLGTSSFFEKFEWTELKHEELSKFASSNKLNAIEYTEIDDFKFLVDKPLTKTRDNSPCVLIEFPFDKGVLLTLGSDQLIFDDKKNFSYKDAKCIQPGDYLLFDHIHADFGSNSMSTKRYKLASEWKKVLKEKYREGPEKLVKSLTLCGIKLCNLDQALLRWMQTDNEVISAPQSQLHFELLINELNRLSQDQVPWKDAWAEIQRSRVNAIQDGRIESNIVNDQLLNELNKAKQTIIVKSFQGEFFTESLSQNNGLTGSIDFYPVVDVAGGFRAPHEHLKDIKPISQLELFRINI